MAAPDLIEIAIARSLFGVFFETMDMVSGCPILNKKLITAIAAPRANAEVAYTDANNRIAEMKML